MNIYAKHGDRVVFTDANAGYHGQGARALEVLELGATYTVDYVEVHSSSSYVFLQERPNDSFNTVLFDDLYPLPDSEVDELTRVSRYINRNCLPQVTQRRESLVSAAQAREATPHARHNRHQAV